MFDERGARFEDGYAEIHTEFNEKDPGGGGLLLEFKVGKIKIKDKLCETLRLESPGNLLSLFPSEFIIGCQWETY